MPINSTPYDDAFHTLLNDCKNRDLPHSEVLSLRSTRETPDEMTIRMIAPAGELAYKIPVVKMQRYPLKEIFDRNLYFLIPFYIFTHESRFRRYKEELSWP